MCQVADEDLRFAIELVGHDVEIAVIVEVEPWLCRAPIAPWLHTQYEFGGAKAMSALIFKYGGDIFEPVVAAIGKTEKGLI